LSKAYGKKRREAYKDRNPPFILHPRHHQRYVKKDREKTDINLTPVQLVYLEANID